MNQPFDERRGDDATSDSPPPVQQPRSVHVTLPASTPYVTFGIIGVTVLFYIFQIASSFLPVHPPTFYSDMDWLEYFGARVNEDILNGQVWRFLTPALLHGSLTHIFFNLYALFSLGVNLERYFGHGKFLILYTLGAFAGNVASFLFTSGAYSVGASTAIFGLIGAEGVFFYQNRRLFGDRARSAIGNIVFIALFNLIVIGSLPFIDNWGHIGGLIGGLMFTGFAGPLWEVEGIPPAAQLVDQREGRDVFTGAVVTAVIFGALAVWGFIR